MYLQCPRRTSVSSLSSPFLLRRSNFHHLRVSTISSRPTKKRSRHSLVSHLSGDPRPSVSSSMGKTMGPMFIRSVKTLPGIPRWSPQLSPFTHHFKSTRVRECTRSLWDPCTLVSSNQAISALASSARRSSDSNLVSAMSTREPKNSLNTCHLRRN